MPQEPGEIERPIINIEGELVALGPIRRDLVPTYLRWMNDWETVRTLALAPAPMTEERETAWYEGTATGGDMLIFTIYERSTWRPVGNADLRHVDWRHGTAEFGIVIGEPDARGKGYGTETARLMLDYAFTALGLHSVMLTVTAYNLAGQRAYQKAGFREIGRRREAWRFGGRRWDVIYMDCVASEFESPVLAKVFVPDTPRP